MFNGNTDENAVIARKNLNASVLYLIMYEVFERRKAMTEIKVSVIVPVYNAEKNLETCLESIVHQTLPDIEIIIVDDGSNDSSRDILKKYADSDERISLIFQNNQYAGVARNNGKKKARGKYLVFWDSDDFFRLDALEKMYDSCEKTQAQVCVCNGNQFLDDKGKTVPAPAYLRKKYLPDHVPFSAEEAADGILNFTAEAPWNKMFLRSYIEELDLDFQPSRNVNDAYFVCVALCLAKRITIVEDELVTYRKNQKDNLVNTVSKANLAPYQAWADIKTKLCRENAFPQKSFENKALDVVVYHLHHTQGYEAFADSVRYLKREGLAALGLKEREEGYYSSKWKEACLVHLLCDTPEEFLAFFAYNTYCQLYTSDAERYLLERRLAASKEDNRKIRESKSYKIGKMITWLPGKLKRKK